MSEKELVIKEIKACAEDPVYFISRYVKVIHPIRGLVPFELYPFQKIIIKALQDNRFNILRKFRQAGCTTIASAYSLWIITFGENKTVAILSKGDVEAVEVLDRIKGMHRELPPFLKVPELESNKHNLKLKNGSAVKSRASGKEAGRSLSANFLIIDEAAFIEQIETIYAAAYPTVSTGGSIFVLSTVNGIGNWYHTQWVKAVEEQSDYHAIEINWQDHPEYHPQPGWEHVYIKNWEKTTRANTSPRQWRQEYECVDGETLVTVQDDEGNIYDLTMHELYCRLNNP